MSAAVRKVRIGRESGRSVRGWTWKSRSLPWPSLMRTSGALVGRSCAGAAGATNTAASRASGSVARLVIAHIRRRSRIRFRPADFHFHLLVLACVQAIIITTVGRDLGLLLKHLLRSTNREFFSELQDAGISFSQLKCLGLLADADSPRSLGALSEEIGLSLAAVSRAVDALVQRGEVKRE